MTRFLLLAAWLLPACADATAPAPPPVLTETFGDWVLLRTAGIGVVAARKADYEAAYARQTGPSAGEPVLVPLFQLLPKDDGEAGATLNVTAKPYGDPLRIYKKQESGVPMAVAHCGAAAGCDTPDKREDISAARCDMKSAFECRGTEDNLKFRGDWSRKIRVRAEDGTTPVLGSPQAAIAQLPENRRVYAAAIQNSNPAAFHALIAEWQDGKSPMVALDLYAESYAKSKPELKLTADGKPDAYGSLHPVERAALEQLPAAQRDALRKRLEGAKDKAAAEALLGEVHKSVGGYLAAGGSPAALDQLKTAQFLQGNAAVAFDASRAGPPGAVVKGAAPPPAGPTGGALINGKPGDGGAQVSPHTAAPPGPAGPAAPAGEKGGLLSNPWVTGIGGAVIGGILGKLLFGAMLGGPFGLVAGAIMGAGIAMTLGNLFGK